MSPPKAINSIIKDLSEEEEISNNEFEKTMTIDQ
jgi:hypothetical protein